MGASPLFDKLKTWVTSVDDAAQHGESPDHHAGIDAFAALAAVIAWSEQHLTSAQCHELAVAVDEALR